MRNLLTQWGKRQQQLPSENDLYKHRVLDSLHLQDVKVKRPLRFAYVTFMWGIVALTLFLAIKASISWFSPHLVSDSRQPYEAASQKARFDAERKLTKDDLGITYGQYTGLGTRDTRGLYGIVESVGESLSNLIDPVPSTDIREFMKVGYNVAIKTRQVDTLAMRSQTIIRGYGGRVDNASINNKFASISFVVPKKSFEAFKIELESLVGKRFITESLNSQNLLPRKVSIEEQTKTASSSLADYQSQRKDLTDKHNRTVAGYQSQISYYSNQIWNARQELKKTTSTALQAELQMRINSANNEWSRIKRLMDSENSDYNKKVAALDNQIKTQQNQLANLKIQDVNLTDDVETVQGTIMVSWVSYWEIIELYIPFYKWLIAGAMLIVILVAVFGRGRSFEAV